MNAYAVRTREIRSYVEPILDDGSGPSFPVRPLAPVVAETPAQAKRMFLDEFGHRPRSGVELDDWTELRVRLLRRSVDLPPGIREDDDELWAWIFEAEIA